jgi:NAD(P)-dependent dehydrogenase (short-subunit alcohol dehydrogenase family)
MARLEGKVAIVTGAGTKGAGIGNGRAIAVTFARNGAKVLLVDQDETAAQETLKLISSAGGEAAVHAPVDVTNPAACLTIADRAFSLYGGIHILVNNVGVVTRTRKTVVDMDLDDFERVITTNVTSMMLVSRCIIPVIRKSGGGTIINIGSYAGNHPVPKSSAYATSKGAVIAFTKALAVDHGPDGIRVNCIAPGMVITPMGLSNQLGDKETPEEAEKREAAEKEARRKMSLLDINGTAWDIANAALFLASEDARYITGIILEVDGGAALK